MAAINRYYSSTKYSSRTDALKSGVKCVFLAHQQRDKDQAKKVADYLQNAGIEVYFDEYDRDLRFHHQNGNAKEVTKAICAGINNSSHMLVVVSPNTVTSTWVPFEIGYGYDKTELAVLCLKGIPVGTLPAYVKTARVIRDIYDINGFVSSFSGKSKEQLIETKMMSSHDSVQNSLADVMDKLIIDR